MERCGVCSQVFPNSLRLGQHYAQRHRGAGSSGAIGSEIGHGGSSDDVITPGYDALLLSHCISDEVYKLYESFCDTSEPIFDGTETLDPSLDVLCDQGKILLDFCCKRMFTRKEVAEHYDLSTKMTGIGNCDCPSAFLAQFPTRSQFVNYVAKVRRKFVACQGWRVASIKTCLGQNTTGVYRCPQDLILKEISKAGGMQSIMNYKENILQGERVFSSAIDSNSMKAYSQTIPSPGRLVAFDLYADGTTLAKSGVHSANNVRLRLVNIKGRSTEWHEIGIAPSMQDNHAVSRTKMAFERALLFQRFMFLLLKDVSIASKKGIFLEGEHIPLILRLNAIVADQKQERPFFCLKSTGSFRDCSQCIMPTRNLTEDPEESSGDESERETRLDGDIYQAQTSLSTVQVGRNVRSTVWKQIVVVKEILGILQVHNGAPDVIRCRAYLRRMSAIELPPALSCIYGLGTEPYHLYDSIAYDRLHAFDLGLLRTLPDMAFSLLKTAGYNKSMVRKSELIRIANQRFQDLPRVFPLNVAPFRQDGNEVHPGMTGTDRQQIATFLWVALMGLQPYASADSDMLLQAALYLNEIQVQLRGINQSRASRMRTKSQIEDLQKLCFEAGIYLSRAVSVPITTKLHRTMRHVRDHLYMFGCSRLGESDENETMHKPTKKSYYATNKKIELIGPQLLAVRAIAQTHPSTSVSQSGDFDSSYVASVLMVASPHQSERATRYEEPEFSFGYSQKCNTEAMKLEVLLKGQCVNHVLQIVTAQIQPSTLEQVWTQRNSMKFNAVFPWIEESETGVDVRQIAYAGKNINSAGPRFDAIEYMHGPIVRRGVLEAIVERKLLTGEMAKVCIIRRLIEVPPEPGNINVVEKFGHTRYRFEISPGEDGDVILDCVPKEKIRRLLVVVPDMYDFSDRYSISSRMNSAQDTIEERRAVRFFSVRGYQFSSNPSKSC